MTIRSKIQSLKFRGQNVARKRIGATPGEATQRMRNLRARSPITGQIGHPIKFPRPKYGMQTIGAKIPKPFGGKIYYKVTYLYNRVRSKIPIPKILGR